MNSYRTRFLLVVTTAIVLSACGGPRAVVDDRPDAPSGDLPALSAMDVADRIAEATQGIRTYSARGQINIQSPQQRGTYAVNVRASASDSLYLSVGQFGIEGLRALVTRDSFFVYDVLRNKLSYGGIDQARDILPVPLGGDEAFRTLIGTILPDIAHRWQINSGGRYYTMSDQTTSGRDQHRTLVVDPVLWSVLRYEERDASGELVEERLYSDHADVGGYMLPRRIAFNVPGHETSVTLVYRDVSVNPGPLEMSLRVNRSAQRELIGSR